MRTDPHQSITVEILAADHHATLEMLEHQRQMIATPQRQNQELSLNARRYSLVRSMNVRQFAEMYQTNISTGWTFDGLVDRELRKRKML